MVLPLGVFLPTDLLSDVFIFASIYDVVRVSIIGTVKAADRTKKKSCCVCGV